MSDLGNRYLNDQKEKILIRLKAIEKKLPPVCHDFLTFYLSAKNAQPRTVLSYAQDLEVFFYFLEK